MIDVREKVWLVDFNVFGPPTNALLFEWSELLFTMAVNNSVSDGDGHAILNTIDYRVVQGKSEALPSEAGLYRGPIDASLSKDFPNFISLCKQQALQDSDEDSDD